MLLVLLAVAVHSFSKRFVDWSVSTLLAKVTPSALRDFCTSAVETGLHDKVRDSAAEAGETLAMLLESLAPAALCMYTSPMLLCNACDGILSTARLCSVQAVCAILYVLATCCVCWGIHSCRSYHSPSCPGCGCSYSQAAHN